MYHVQYRNLNHTEHSPNFETRAEAEQCAQFLRSQGAKNIRIMDGPYYPCRRR